VAASLALFLVLTGGTAFALSGSNTVFSDDITDDQVSSADVRNDGVPGGGLSAADLRAGSVGTAELQQGAVTTSDIAPGAVPRAYAYVNAGATIDPARSKGVKVYPNDSLSAGSYCFDLNFTPKSVSATPEGFESPDVFIVQAHTGSQFNCHNPDDQPVEASANTFKWLGSTFGAVNEPFYIQFYD